MARELVVAFVLAVAQGADHMTRGSKSVCVSSRPSLTSHSRQDSVMELFERPSLLPASPQKALL